MARVYVGLGSNIKPEANLRLGIVELRNLYGRLDLSAVYRSAALGFDGADFLNMVAGFETDSPPLEIHDQIERIHDCAGRHRGSDKFASRPLDIDLLLYGDLVTDEYRFKIPRSDVLEYAFVLRPLSELDPHLKHPVSRRPLTEHWREFDASAHPLQRIDGVLDVLLD